MSELVAESPVENLDSSPAEPSPYPATSLPFDEICSLYPDQWVVLVDLVQPRCRRPVSGRVVYACRKRNDAEAAYRGFVLDGSVGSFFTGRHFGRFEVFSS